MKAREAQEGIAKTDDSSSKAVQQSFGIVTDGQQKMGCKARRVYRADEFLIKLRNAGTIERRTQVLFETIEDDEKMHPESFVPCHKAVRQKRQRCTRWYVLAAQRVENTRHQGWERLAVPPIEENGDPDPCRFALGTVGRKRGGYPGLPVLRQ